MANATILEMLRDLVEKGIPIPQGSRITYPAPIAKTLGCRLVAIGLATSTVEMTTDTSQHANPMGTVHGGVLADLADMAIGTAHSTTLDEGESFTSVDLQINFFRPVWNETLTAVAKPIHLGKTIGRYLCDVTRADGKMVAQVLSTVMTLRGDTAKGR